MKRLLLASFVLELAVAFAVVDISRLMSTASEKYGVRGTELITQWSQMVAETRSKTDIEKLTIVNSFVNRRVLQRDDIEIWGQKDYWATPLEVLGRGMGDCEDYTIAKYITLLELGIPEDQLRLIYIMARTGSAQSPHNLAHMVLGYYPQPLEDPLILDSLISSIRVASMRPDLLPIFSFNREGIHAKGVSYDDPTVRLSRWRDVLDRISKEGW